MISMVVALCGGTSIRSGLVLNLWNGSRAERSACAPRTSATNKHHHDRRQDVRGSTCFDRSKVRTDQAVRVLAVSGAQQAILITSSPDDDQRGQDFIHCQFEGFIPYFHVSVLEAMGSSTAEQQGDFHPVGRSR